MLLLFLLALVLPLALPGACFAASIARVSDRSDLTASGCEPIELNTLDTQEGRLFRMLEVGTGTLYNWYM